MEITIKTNTNELSKQQQGDISEPKILTSEDKKKLTRLVATCYEALNIYGKSPEQLEAITMLMQMTLKEHPYEIIREAFEQHIKGSSTMPTPHDILERIKTIKNELPCVSYDNGLNDKQLERLNKLRERDR